MEVKYVLWIPIKKCLWLEEWTGIFIWRWYKEIHWDSLTYRKSKPGVSKDPFTNIKGGEYADRKETTKEIMIWQNWWESENEMWEIKGTKGNG